MPLGGPASPPPFNLRACGFPAHGLPMTIWTWSRSVQMADRCGLTYHPNHQTGNIAASAAST